MDKAEELRLLGQIISQGQPLVHQIVPTAAPSAPAIPPPAGRRWGAPAKGADTSGERMLTSGKVYRGTGPEAKRGDFRNFSGGDLGNGIYVTPHEWLAETYGGGPNARMSNGTRVVHSYSIPELPPTQKALLTGGKKYGEDVQIRDGTGKEIYSGPWKPQMMESALRQHPQIKMVIGTDNSVGMNQVAVRDPSILK